MTLSCLEVEQYLHQHIPLSKLMAVSVVAIDATGVVLSAPLAPNINHRSTVFGGSLSAVAILSAWTWLHVQLQALSMPCRIVIQSNRVDYLKPITGAFHCHCASPPQEDWTRFLATVSRRGKGRITLTAEIHAEGLLAGNYQGEYVALMVPSK
ncbi:YiiD C-terminal domain-containing protein [Phormidium tenue FACHB-886]|nr:YiiD C-terminal domain-containing protein [Phormidium tenue FACHB-886]